VITRGSVATGGAAGLALAGVFVAVVAGTAGWAHLDQQVRADWWLLAPLLAGFATQVALMDRAAPSAPARPRGGGVGGRGCRCVTVAGESPDDVAVRAAIDEAGYTVVG